MAPRNSDASTSYKKKNFNVDDCDVNGKDIVPGLLHKKHKVVKLIKNQMQKIQQDGFLCGSTGSELLDEESQELAGQRLDRYRRDLSVSSSRVEIGAILCWSFLMLLLTLFLLIFLMAWISAGPLSNSIAHTPIPTTSFVRTEGFCALEKKYLLRWSKPEYFE